MNTIRLKGIGKIRVMKSDPVPNPRCIDCGVDTDAINENGYMLHDDLWRQANPAEAGMLCVNCCEKRLGRKLCRNDFRPWVISAFEDGLPVSKQLKDRLS
jgi:hypothetical protein